MSGSPELRSREGKDAELDKRIEALRKKNEALIKRYQEIEEDRKKAEQEGISVTSLLRARPAEPQPPRRMVAKDLSVTIQLLPAPGAKAVLKPRKPSGTPKASRGLPPSPLSPSCPSPQGEQPPAPFWEGAKGPSAPSGDRGNRGRRSWGRGGGGKVATGSDGGPDRRSKEWEERRRQNIEKMNEEMEKIAEYERNQRDGHPEKNPVRNFLDDPRRCGPCQEEGDRREGSRRHGRNWGGADFEKVKAGMEREKSWQTPGHRSLGKGGSSSCLDMTLSMTGRERAEYLRWKKEREQIDQERLARHRKPSGQWRREWDAEKSDSMFKDSPPSLEGNPQECPRPPPPPPKPPTFGDFLPSHHPQRRRRRRRKSQGHPAGSKPYSMHDNRWEEKELPEASQEATREKAAANPKQKLPEASLSPEEDEDQWEDVSEEEEEEEEQEELTPKPEEPQKGQNLPQTEAAMLSSPNPGGGEGARSPSSPFSPRELQQQVDWAQEMELRSPQSPLAALSLPKWSGGGGESPGLSSREPSESRQEAAGAPQEEERRKEEEEEEEKRRKQAAAAFPEEQEEEEEEQEEEEEAEEEEAEEEEAAGGSSEVEISDFTRANQAS